MDRLKETREGSIRDLRPELRKLVEQYISSDEEILLCCGTIEEVENIGAIFTSHLPVYRADIITASQLVHASYDTRSWGAKSASSYRLGDITSIQLSGGGGDYGYSVHTHLGGEGGITCTFASLQISKKFADTLQRAIDQAKTVSTNVISNSNLEERLRTLTRLHQEGLISDTEFQQKREEILGEL